MTQTTPPAPRDRTGDGFTFIAILCAAIALIFGVVSLGLGARAVDESKQNRLSATGATGAPSSVMVHLTEFALDPASVTVAVGGELNVMNTGAATHNLAIKGGASTPDIAPNGAATLPLGDLAAGSYTMYCTIAGHETAGMTGTLEVVAGGGDIAAPTAPAEKHEMTPEEMDKAMNDSIAAFPAKTDGIGAQELKPKVLADGTKQFSLTAKIVDWEVSPGKKVEAWTYNGTVPGPTLRVDPGDKVRVVIKNELPESTAIHFHGLITPNSMDGVAPITQQPVKQGETFTYAWTAQDSPAVGMYHSHQDAVKQVPNGMAGAFLIGQLPVPEGVSVSQETTMMLNDAGTIGLTLNGKSFPATAPIVAKAGEWVELHYLNEGAGVHPMHLHGLAQLVIAKDGFPLEQPYTADTILVGPGERYSVLVHADNPGTWVWHCHILSHAENETGMFGMVTAMVVT